MELSERLFSSSSYHVPLFSEFSDSSADPRTVPSFLGALTSLFWVPQSLFDFALTEGPWEPQDQCWGIREASSLTDTCIPSSLGLAHLIGMCP